MAPSPTLKVASATLLQRNHPQTGNHIAMNKDVIAGNWKQVKGKAQARWGDLTDDVFDVTEGDATYLTGKLQEQYGWDRDRAENEVRAFERTLQS